VTQNSAPDFNQLPSSSLNTNLSNDINQSPLVTNSSLWRSAIASSSLNNNNWARAIGGGSIDEGKAIAVDNSGNVYTTGYFQDNVDLNRDGTVERNVGLNDVFITKQNSNGTFAWARSFGGPSFDEGRDIAVDGSGNVYTTGVFQSSIDFDGDGRANLISAGAEDIFITKHNSDGTFAWGKRIGSSSTDEGRGITVDSNGNIYVTGLFQGSIDLDENGINEVTSAGDRDIFIVKYNADGTYSWGRRIGGTGTDEARDIAVDNSGNVYTTGRLSSNIDLDGDGTIEAGGGLSDIFITKHNTNGIIDWAKRIGGANIDEGFSIAVDSQGSVYTTGRFFNSIDFNSTTRLTSEGNDDIFISKHNRNGSFAWAKRIGGPSSERAVAITVDSNDDVYTTGLFQNNVDLNGDGIAENASAGGDVFITRHNTDGQIIWARQIGSTLAGDEGAGIAADGEGYIYAAGYFQGTVDLDGNPTTSELVGNGNRDAFAIKFKNNVAPNLDISKSVVLSPINQGTPAPASSPDGTSISQLIDLSSVAGGLDNVTDNDAEALTGIAITTANTTNGRWYYSIDEGTSWTEFPTTPLAENRALLLADNARIYFQPNPTFLGDIANAFTFRAWDRTSGTNGGIANTVGNNSGGFTAFSANVETVSTSVIPALKNDNFADRISLNGVTLPVRGTNIGATGEDGEPVQSGTLNTSWWSWTAPFSGIASIDTRNSNFDTFLSIYRGQEFNELVLIGNNNDAEALKTSLVEFNAVAGQTYQIAVDGFGSAAGVITLNLNLQNVAPVLTDRVINLNRQTEDAPLPLGQTGTLVSQLIDLDATPEGINNVNDTPGSLTGIAITTVDTTNGRWFYSIDNGVNWMQFPTGITENQSLLLASDANTRIYFQPNGDYNGTIENAITFRAWDQTNSNGRNGGLANTSGTSNGGSTAFSSLTDTARIIVNAVNDIPGFIKGGNITVNEDAETQVITDWAKNISKGPNDESGQNLTFEVTNNKSELFEIQPTVNSNGELTFKPKANMSGTATVTLGLKDDGGTENDGKDTSPEQSFTITINPVNDVPTFTKGENITINEDAETQKLEKWVTNISKGATDESGQTLNFEISNNNVQLFEIQPSINIDGDLIFKPVANKSGSATVKIKLRDDGLGTNTGIDTSGEEEFTITVNSVNDVPSFNKGTDITINEDFGTREIVGWASNLSKGPVDEAEQTLTFEVTNDNNDLFENQPTVNSDGNLTFKSKDNRSGTATVTVKLKDSGETENDGKDTSAEQTFIINVIDVNDAPTFTIGENLEFNEDVDTQIIKKWVTNISRGTEDEKEQTLNFELSSNNDDLFEVLPTINTDGDLSFKPKADKVGTATITVKLKDNAGTANNGKDTSEPQTLTITLNPINDAPNFIKGADIEVDEDSDTRIIKAWATGLSKGPIDENEQTLTFELSNNNTELFDEQPTVSPNGDLSFKARANKSGTAIVTVKVRDSGGTDLSGKDTSESQTFNITIRESNDAPELANNSFSISEGRALTLTSANLSAIDIDTDVATLIFNVSDITNGRFELASNPGEEITSFTQANITAGLVKFIHNGLEITPSFKINVSDGTGATTAVRGEITFTNMADDHDLNGDGKADIIWRNNNIGADGNADSAVWLLDGFNLLPGNSSLLTGVNAEWKIVGSGDFDGDLKADIIWRNSRTGENAIWLMNGLSEGQQDFITRVEDTNWKIITTADFNGDRKDDLLWRNVRTGENAIWFMDGFTSDRQFLETRVVPDLNWQMVKAGDFNSDGKADILWRNFRTGDNAIWLMNGIKSIQEKFITKVGDLNWRIEQIGDFDGDGNSDIVWRNSGTGENAIWFMNGAQTKRESFITQVRGAEWVIEATGDYNGDGYFDFLWRNYNSGENAIWWMNGANSLKEDFIYDKNASILKIDKSWEIFL
jgi:Cadherin-like/Beta-propeller repeat/Bacterial Ig domain/FG-GAP-like repeat